MNLFNHFKCSLIFILSIFSCSPYPSEVNSALSKAGKNKKELVQVLEKYRGKDSLKYESACYLIANMPYHASANEIVLDKQYDNYFNKLDSLYNKFFGDKTLKEIKELQFKIPDSIRNKLLEEYSSLPKPTYYEGKSDIEKVSADFLIDNIEMAFYVWNNTPILKNMSFEEFKESILPYRTSDECLLYKRSELYKKFFHQFSKDGIKDIKNPIEWYKLYVLKTQRINYYSYLNENLGLYDLFLPSSEFNCHNQVNWTCNIFRSCGIPVNYEFTPQWTDRENRHFWCVSPDSSGIFKPYSIPSNNLLGDWESNLRYAAKVYRKSFGVNKDSPYFTKNKKEFIPDVFNNPTLIDESFRYKQTISVELPFEVKSSNNLSYLSLVTRSGLVPIAWGKIDKDRHISFFKHIPLNIVFIHSYYDGNELKPIGYPFLLKSNKNEISYIQKPLTSNFISNEPILNLSSSHSINSDIFYKELKYSSSNKISKMHILRKFPIKEHLSKDNKNLIGSYLLGGNDFKGTFDTLHIFKNQLLPYLQQIEINNKKSYRFYRITNSNRRKIFISSIEFLADKSKNHECSIPSKLPIFDEFQQSTKSELFKIKGTPKKYCLEAFDNNLETYVNYHSVDIDFIYPIKIKSILIAPRTAVNHIVRGDLYSLSYFDGFTWKEVFRQKASQNFLNVKNVPSGSLYLLKNLSNGKEEMPFIYENNQQIFLK